jgi:hypothetical protein
VTVLAFIADLLRVRDRPASNLRIRKRRRGGESQPIAVLLHDLANKPTTPIAELPPFGRLCQPPFAILGDRMLCVREGEGGPGAPSTWLAYVLVDDIRAATSKAKSLGATIAKEATEIPGVGWFSVIVDPTGATLALWKPKQM